MFNRNDPLIDAVKQVMAENERERNAVNSVNEMFGVQSKRQLPHERHAEYDAALSKVMSGATKESLTEELKGAQHKIDANKNNRIDSHDFKLLRAKKEKKPEEHGVEAEREMAAKGKKMYENNDESCEPEEKKEKKLDEASYSAKAARAGKDIGKPGKMFKKIAASAGKKYGSEERGQKVAGAVLAKLRAKKLKEESEDSDPAIVSEKAPSGAKFERMVKHIKAGYAKDGSLSKKEKSIAYATAWKAKNKKNIDEASLGDIVGGIKNFFGSGARQDAANASAKANAARVGTDPGAAASASRPISQAPAGPRDSAPSTGPSGTSAQGMTMSQAINKSPALSSKFDSGTGKAQTPASAASRFAPAVAGPGSARPSTSSATPTSSAGRQSEISASKSANVPDSRTLRAPVKAGAGEGSVGKGLASGGISKQDRTSQSFVDSQLGAGKFKAGTAASNMALLAKSKAASSAVASAENAGKASTAAKPAAAKPMPARPGQSTSGIAKGPSLGGGVRE